MQKQHSEKLSQHLLPRFLKSDLQAAPFEAACILLEAFDGLSLPNIKNFGFSGGFLLSKFGA